MSKRNYVGVLSIILVVLFVLTGCGNIQQDSSVQQKILYDKYSKLQEDYNNLKNSYVKLQEECKKLQQLPDIVISLIDDRNQVVDLTLHSSLEESQKDYSKCYYRIGSYGTNKYNVTITCNNGESIDDIYWIHLDGEIESFMDKVDNLDNTYTFQITPNSYHVDSIIIKCNNKNFYTSIYATSSIYDF